jgi:SagB-type dehydrogenase family enzyme
MTDDSGLVTDLSDVSVSELFHENSKQRRSDFRMVERILAVTNNPLLRGLLGRSRKCYPSTLRIPLPRDLPASARTFDEVVLTRRSVRTFETHPIAVTEVAKILAFSYGCHGEQTESHEPRLRACPSGGALYPLEVYLAAWRVEGVEPGIYHYDVEDHALEQVRSADPGPALAMATHIPQVAEAAAAIALAGVPLRTRMKYGERGYRFMLLEAGHACQNLLLAVAALGLAAVPIGGFIDDEVDEVLEIDGVDEVSLYLVAVGRGRLDLSQEPTQKHQRAMARPAT